MPFVLRHNLASNCRHQPRVRGGVAALTITILILIPIIMILTTIGKRRHGLLVWRDYDERFNDEDIKETNNEDEDENEIRYTKITAYTKD